MDIRMPEMDGLQATARIVDELGGDVRVLILTTFEPDEYVYRALRAGASGFVLKDIPPEQLVVAVRTVAEGGALLAPSVTRRLIGEFAAQRGVDPALAARLAELTARERDVVTAVAQGPQQRRDRRRAVHRTRDREVARLERADEAGPARPRADRGGGY
jgi:DNA-binding NarL/FixJ family response regulator